MSDSWRTCKHCVHWHPYDDPWGHCWRYPPDHDGYNESHRDKWCGEFQVIADRIEIVDGEVRLKEDEDELFGIS